MHKHCRSFDAYDNFFLNLAGLESNRGNLLLGLIIRQKPKRDFVPVDVNESARIVPETKPVATSAKDARTTEEEEKLFLSSLTTPRDKVKEKLNAAVTEEDGAEPNADAFEEPTAAEGGSLESQRPLRFLPGVLVGWGGELPPLPDFSNKPAPLDEELAPKTEAVPGAVKSPTAPATASRERFVIKKKEVKTVKAEPELPPPQTTTPADTSSSDKEVAATPGTPVSLKDKPPDVSTEAFLDSLTETADKATSQDAQVNPAKPPLSGILKKSSAYPANQESAATPALRDQPPTVPKPTLPAVTTFHQGLLQISQSRNQAEEAHKAASPPTVQTAEPPHNSVPGLGDTLVCSQSPDQSHNAEDAGAADHRPSSLARDTRPVEERYTDPWERPRNTEPRYQGRHGHHRDSHHGKKSRHRERDKRHERTHEDKERNRHYGHSDDHYGEKRKERDGRHKERHRHRRDSDYENGRRSSRDSYS